MLKPKGEFVKESLIPLGLLVLNLLLKFTFVDLMAIGHDEPHTIHYASLDKVWRIIVEATHTNNPPLFEVLLHYWMELFGSSVVSMRTLPVLFSSLSVLVINRIGTKFFNPSVGLLAALTFTFSDLHILHSHNIRVYALYTLLCCISMYSFLRLTKEPSNKKHLILLALVNAINLHVHFFTAFVILVQGASLIVLKELRRSLLKNYLLAGLGTLALFLPYLALSYTRFRFLDQYQEGGIDLISPNLGALYGQMTEFLNTPFMAVTFALIFLVAASFFMSRWYRDRPLVLSVPSKIVLIWSIGLYIFLFALSQEIPIFISRYLIFVSVGFYFLLAISVDLLARKVPKGYFLSAFVVVVMITTCHPNKDNYSKRGDSRMLFQHLVHPKETEKQGKNSSLIVPYGRIPLHHAPYPRANPLPSSLPARALRSPSERSVPHPALGMKHWTG